MSTEITINQDIVEVNVTEQVITIEAPSGAYPLPSLVNSVFGRVGNVVAQEGDYTLTQLGGVTITTPSNGQVLKYNGTQWVNGTDTDTGLTSVGLSMPSAFSVANSPLTANGTLSVTGAGTTAQYVRGDGTLATFPVIAQEAQRLITEVYNSTGATLAKGSIVYINGGQGNLPTVTKAIATSDATSAQTYGVVQSDITNMNNGFVVAMGSLTNLDTQVYPVGTQLYLSATTAGAWTSTKPYAPLHLVYVGIVVRSHPTQGVVEIRIQNGYELDELHDVSAQNPTNGDILQYVAATDLWTKAAGTTTNIAEGTNLYFTDARARAAITLTTTGTSGAATYSGGTLNIPQYQGVLTNPVTGTGTTNTLPKFTGASTIGNSNVIDSGSLITLGSNTTISSGGLQIGPNTLSTHSIRVGKNVTGSAFISVVANDGSIQSDVTSNVWNYRSGTRTAAASFTLTSFTHFIADQTSIGAGSSITTQEGFVVNSTMTGATNNYGFRGAIPSGTNRFNLYMDGTANNYLAGSLGVGTLSIGNTSLAIGKNITGAASILVVSQSGIVQSDANTNVIAFNNQINTQATSFALTQYIHYNATQGTIGAGSSVGTNTGFNVSPSMIGGTNNYGFRGSIPVGTNRWNLYMDGTAANYLSGDTAIGTTSLGTATMFTLGGTETAVSAIARGQLINTTLVASANSDTLVGLDIAPTFTNGAFTGVRNIALRSSGDIQIPNNANINTLKTNGQPFSLIKMDTSDTVLLGNLQSNTQVYGVNILFRTNTNAAGQIFTSTNNFLIQNGGTFTDAGFRLEVNGLTRFIGTASSDTAALGSELAAVTGTGTNWTLAGTNLNVGGYTHTTGSVVPLTTALAAVNGTYYQIAYTITGRTTGSITIDYGGTSTSGITATGATGPLASSTAVLTITPTTDFNGTVVLSIKSIGTSVASSTFASSALVIGTEIRASDIGSNLFFGRNNGRRNTTGSNNTFVGSQVGINNTTASFNTFLGSQVGVNNTTGNQNTFLGMNTGNANTIGGSNTFVGAFSGQANTTGANNTFVGLISGAANTTGTSNTFIGRESGTKNTSGNNNTFVGLSAGQENTTGTGNVVVGVTSAQLNTTGNDNSVVGYLALNANVGGSFNLAFGRDAGRYIANKSTSATVLNNSIMIGYRTSPLADSQTNQIVIGHDATGLGSNTTVIGNSSTTTTALYGDLLLGTTTPSTATILTVSGTETASSAIARGGLINTTLVASANNDVLVGLDIQPTFTNGAFTGVQNTALRLNGNLTLPYDNTAIIVGNNADIGIVKKFGAAGFYAFGSAFDFVIAQSNTSTIYPSNTFTNKLSISATTGLLTLTNGILSGSPSADNYGVEILNELAMVKKSGGGGFIAYPANRDFFIAQSTANSVTATNTFNRRLTINQTSGNVLINTTTDVASSKLTIASTTQGFLPPRMTTVQKLAIATPAAGLMVYDTTLNQMSYYNGTTWINF